MLSNPKAATAATAAMAAMAATAAMSLSLHLMLVTLH
jgi:hypothetical protein